MENKIDRKALAKELAEEIGAEVRYLGVPSCAYRVGPYTINRDASIGGDDLEAIRAFLIRHDYIHEEPAAVPVEEENEEENSMEVVPEQEETPAEEAPADSRACEDAMTETNVSVPVESLTPASMVNLLRLVYAKQKLISAMIQSDFLFIDEEVIDILNDEKPDTMEAISELIQNEANVNMLRGLDLKDERLTFSFPYDDDDPTRWASYAKLLLALIDRAKAAQHINAKPITPASSEMKYCCNSLLMQLGFSGPDFKTERAVLLGHLPGYAAFKSTEKMEAHKARFSERRKAARLAAEESDVGAKTESDLKAEGVSE